MFTKATRQQARLHLALIGPAGSGKTYTSLRVATALGGRVALIDTERSSACTYAKLFDFDVCALEDHHPQRYIEAIHAAGRAGYDVLVLDSLSHAWNGRSGALELVDRAAKRSRSGNSFGAWREVTPLHHRLVDALLSYPGHVIATMRTKMAYVQEKDSNGRTQVRKVGLQPLQRDGLEYEFDIVGDMDTENTLVISKTRCSELRGAVLHEPGEAFAETLLGWLGEGEPAPTFEEQLAEAAGGDGEGAVLLFLTTGRGDPLEWPADQQQQRLGWLRSEDGQKRLARWQANRTNKDAAHHTMFARETSAFMAELTKRGLDYDKAVKPFCLKARMGKPSTWSPQGLKWFMDAYDKGRWPELTAKARMKTAAKSEA